MEQRGETLADLARGMGVPHGTVQRWSKGTEPKADLLAAAVRHLKISGHWVLTGEGPMERPGFEPDVDRAIRAAVAVAVAEALDGVGQALRVAEGEAQGRAPRPSQQEILAATEAAEEGAKPVVRPARRGASA